MQVPLKISYRHMDASEALSALIAEETEKLEQVCDRITSCRVTVEQPHLHHRKGRHFRVRVDVGIPGASIVVGRDRTHDWHHRDARAAVYDAFKSAERQLHDRIGRARALTAH